MIRIFKSEKEPIEVLFIGYFENNGGMLEYVSCWENELEIKKINYRLLTSDKFRDSESNLDLPTELFDKRILRKLPLYVLGIKYVLWKYFERIPLKEKGIVYIPNASLLSVPLIEFLLKKFPDKKVVYTLHDPKPHNEKIKRVVSILKKRQTKTLYKLLDTKRLFVHVHDFCLIQDIPVLQKHKQVLEYQHPLPVRRVNKTNESFPSFRIGFMGRIEEYKGVDILFEALNLMSTFLEGRKDIELLIIGRNRTSFDLDVFKQLPIKLTVENRFISDIDFHKYMASLDLLVLPYREATQSGVVLMGLSYEVPMIVSKVGALTTLLKNEKKAILIPPNNSSVLAEEIKKYIAQC